MISIAWSGVRSLTHVVYAASWLRPLLAATKEPVTLTNLGLGGFLGQEPVTHPEIRELLPQDERLTYVESGKPPLGSQNYYLATGAVGIKPWLALAAHWHRPFRTIVTDEGLGSYGTWQTRRDAWVREGGREPWPTIRALAVKTASQALTSHRWATYYQSPDGWQVNPQVASEFRRTAPGEKSDFAVFLSQPWVELGVVDETSYLRLIHQVADLATEQGLSLAVRPHPVEDSARYRDWPVLAGRRPAELDDRITKAALVYGTTSTALLNLSALLGQKTVRITSPKIAKLDDQLGEYQRSLLNYFLGSLVLDN